MDFNCYSIAFSLGSVCFPKETFQSILKHVYAIHRWVNCSLIGQSALSFSWKPYPPHQNKSSVIQYIPFSKYKRNNLPNKSINFYSAETIQSFHISSYTIRASLWYLHLVNLCVFMFLKAVHKYVHWSKFWSKLNRDTFYESLLKQAFYITHFPSCIAIQAGSLGQITFSPQLKHSRVCLFWCVCKRDFHVHIWLTEPREKTHQFPKQTRNSKWARCENSLKV